MSNVCMGIKNERDAKCHLFFYTEKNIDSFNSQRKRHYLYLMNSSAGLQPWNIKVPETILIRMEYCLIIRNCVIRNY